MVGWGFLESARFLIHDRDTKFCEAFRSILKDSGVECLDHLVLFGERSLRHAIDQSVQHYLAERNHQGVGNELIAPGGEVGTVAGKIECRDRLGGMLRYYHRDAA